MTEKDRWINLRNEVETKSWEINAHFENTLYRNVVETHEFDDMLKRFNKITSEMRNAIDAYIDKHYK